jgi:hypothetical protein
MSKGFCFFFQKEVLSSCRSSSRGECTFQQPIAAVLA